MQSLEFTYMVFCQALVQHFLTMILESNVHPVMLEGRDLPFNFDFIEVERLREFQKRLNFGF